MFDNLIRYTSLKMKYNKTINFYNRVRQIEYENLVCNQVCKSNLINKFDNQVQ